MFGVVSAAYRVGGCENGRAGVEGCVDSCFGDGDCLLFHCFVDGDLVANVHFVEFVDCTDAASVLILLGFVVVDRVNGTYCKHQCTGFDGEFTCFCVLDD